ncbi:putative coiled-coil domain-containing protein 195 [Dasypus novemcinctus]|uniref:putative coiled-coil domain-containing protein 195 n=1 Tax=Dasypus novemcinctus TaxID=9361 RepID=UPI00265F044F|nr:putative coiled-coil domain-containing protein 195 [Dasypus novemcinctus]
MEANIQLTRVIQEMRAEVDRLEKENQALRVRLTARGQRASGWRGGAGDKREEEARDLGSLEKPPGPSPSVLHRNVPTPSAPTEQEHQGNVMIVRRYFISSPVHSFAANDPWKPEKYHPNSGIPETHRTVKSLAGSSEKKQDNEEKTFVADSFTNNKSSQRGFPEHDFGCRNKIKTVSFLLPMGMSSYSKNSSSLKYSQN